MRRCLLPKFYERGRRITPRLFVAFDFGIIIRGGASVQRKKRKPTADGPKNKECTSGIRATEEETTRWSGSNPTANNSDFEFDNSIRLHYP